MRWYLRLIALVLALFIAGASHGEAQSLSLLNVGGAGQQCCLLDQLGVSAAAAYSVRLLRAAYAGKDVNIRRASDNTTMDIGFVNGSLDTTTFSTFCNLTTCFVTKWYDQSGNGRDASQGTAANQPQLLLNQVNGRPALIFNGSSTHLDTASFASQTSPLTLYAVAVRSSGTGYQTMIRVNGVVTGDELDFNNSANNAALFGGSSGSIIKGATDGAYHSFIGVVNGAASVLNVDGAESTGTVSGSASSGILILGYDGSQFLNGGLAEAISFGSGTPTRSVITTSDRTYFGTP